MGFWDRAGGVLGGVKDVVGGGAEFLWDSSRALVAIPTKGPKEGLSIFMDTLQEDLLGQVVGGAFGPEGIIGSVIGGLPEGVRKPFRSVLEPTMEAWDWSIQNLVDRPLGTLATVVNATKLGTNIEELFDGSTWAAAWEINDKRTFGQSVAAAIYNIDPFDEDAYNDIREDDFFNLVSGTADFIQEFADPLAIALGGGANILKGKTVFATVDKAGKVKVVTGRSKFEKMGGVLAPQKIYTPGGGIFRKNLLGKQRLSSEQTAARNMVGQQVVTERVNAYLNTSTWQRVETAMDEVSQGYVKATDGFDAGDILFPGEANKAVNQRFGVLRQQVTRKGSRMSEKAAFAIASGATPEARRLNARLVMGDMSVFNEVGAAAATAKTLMVDDSFLGLVDDYQKANTKAFFSKEDSDIVKRDELRKQLADKTGDLNNVDWVTMYDGYLGVIESQSRRVVDVNGNPTTAFPDIVNTNQEFRDITEMMIRKIAGLENMDSAALKGLGDVAVDSVAKVYTDSLFDYYNRAMDSQRIRRANKKGIDVEYQEYAIRSVITPFGSRKLRIFTERNPQALINFSDSGAFTQWERMLQAASRVTIPVKGKQQKIITKSEINNLLGDWTRITARGGDPGELKILFDDTVDALSAKTDELISKSGINVDADKTLAQTMGESRNMLDPEKPGPTILVDNPLEIGDSLQSGRTIGESGRIKRGMDEDRPGRRAMSTSGKSTTYHVTNPETGVTHAIMTAMTPQQMRQAGVMPRWDLVNTEINRHYRRNGTKNKERCKALKTGFELLLQVVVL